MYNQIKFRLIWKFLPVITLLPFLPLFSGRCSDVSLKSVSDCMQHLRAIPWLLDFVESTGWFQLDGCSQTKLQLDADFVCERRISLDNAEGDELAYGVPHEYPL